MNEITPPGKKRPLPLPLTILGFIGIIIFIAWISIKAVNLAPSAFSSLASLAESLNNRQQEASEQDVNKLIITSNVTLASVNEMITLSWGEPSVPGTFTFSYACQDGVSIDLVDVEGVRSIDCDTNYNIGNVTNLNLSINSERDRYADVSYTVSFLGTNDTTPRASGTSQLTVINTDVKEILTTNDENTDSTEPTEADPTEEVVTTEPTPVTTPVETTKPTYTEEYVYTIPVSDPNGRTDLGVTYLGAGTIVGNTFFPGLVKRNESGAIQFEIKNYSTKTSGNWTFTAALPDGTTYTSDNQLPLKPNERAILTLGFDTTNSSQHTFVVTVSESTDQNALNDAFRKTVTFY